MIQMSDKSTAVLSESSIGFVITSPKTSALISPRATSNLKPSKQQQQHGSHNTDATTPNPSKGPQSPQPPCLLKIQTERVHVLSNKKHIREDLSYGPSCLLQGGSYLLAQTLPVYLIYRVIFAAWACQYGRPSIQLMEKHCR